jgi:hypothetical protein
MKRIFILLTVALFVVGTLVAEEGVLIDFSKLAADIHVKVGEDDQDTTPNQNRQTVMEYSPAIGQFTDAQKAIMKTSLAIANWNVTFSSSSRTVAALQNTYTREAPSKQWGTVMGVRVHYPVENFYSKAYIRPPFEIPAYEAPADVSDDGTISAQTDDSGAPVSGPPYRFTTQNENKVPTQDNPAYGVIHNVGTIKAVAVNAYGLNFPHGLNILLLDSNGVEKSVFMGYLDYDGWAELTWNNPQYIQDVRNREMRIYPIYPTSTPFVKFSGFRLDRDADRIGGDFIAYFKDIKIVYDKAVIETDRDIDDEKLWGIINTRENARRVWEMERFGESQVNQYLERQKQAKEPYDEIKGVKFTPTPGNSDQ